MGYHLIIEIYPWIPFPPSVRKGFSVYTSRVSGWGPVTPATTSTNGHIRESYFMSILLFYINTHREEYAFTRAFGPFAGMDHSHLCNTSHSHLQTYRCTLQVVVCIHLAVHAGGAREECKKCPLSSSSSIMPNPWRRAPHVAVMHMPASQSVRALGQRRKKSGQGSGMGSAHGIK